MSIYTIQPNYKFLETLTLWVWEKYGKNPLGIADLTIFLPSRRACRELKRILLKQSKNKALLLPKIKAIGDIDYDDLSTDILDSDIYEQNADIFKPSSEIKYKLLLIKELIDFNLKSGHRINLDLSLVQATGLAGELEKLLNNFEKQQVEIKGTINDIDDYNQAQHWQDIVQFLTHFEEKWKAVLQNEKIISIPEYRNKLIDAYRKFLLKNPPKNPIIIAGVTANIPVTMNLLKTISGFENCHVVLNGVDKNIDDKAWNDVDDFHPYYFTKRISDCLEIDRGEIEEIFYKSTQKTSSKWLKLLNNAFLPALHTDKWQGLDLYIKGCHSGLDPESCVDVEYANSNRHCEESQSDDVAIQKQEKVIDSRLRGNDTLNKNHIDNITLIETSNEAEESKTISMILEETLIKQNKTACVITSDYNLTRRIKNYFQKYDVNINDAIGTPITKTLPASLIIILAELIENDFAPSSLLSLLKHPLVSLGMDRVELLDLLEDFEIDILRGVRREQGFEWIVEKSEGFYGCHSKKQQSIVECHSQTEGLGIQKSLPNKGGVNEVGGGLNLISNNRDNNEKLTPCSLREPSPLLGGLDPLVMLEDDIKSKAILNLVHKLQSLFQNLLLQFEEISNNGNDAELRDIVEAYIGVAEELCNTKAESGKDILWNNESGAEEIYDFFENLIKYSDKFCRINIRDFSAFITSLMSNIVYKQKYGYHPRLYILSPMEARLINFDTVIIPQLNENSFPKYPDADPWMNRYLKKQFELLSDESLIGASAYDFINLASASEVYLTRSLQKNNITTTKSRFLLRLEGVLGNSGYTINRDDNYPYYIEKRQSLMDSCTRLSRPNPKPPVEKRPKVLSATRIEKLIADPYQIYAQKVLGLKKLDELEREASFLEFGNFIHNTIEDFCKDFWSGVSVCHSGLDTNSNIDKKYTDKNSHNCHSQTEGLGIQKSLPNKGGFDEVGGGLNLISNSKDNDKNLTPYSLRESSPLLGGLDPLATLEDDDGVNKNKSPQQLLELFINKYGERNFKKQFADNQNNRAMWWPRFLNIAKWFIDNEIVVKESSTKVLSEVTGKIYFDNHFEITKDKGRAVFTITAKADRIEITQDGKVKIIDYKTGGVPYESSLRSGKKPQLPIEALIVSSQGFKGIGSANIDSMDFIETKGRKKNCVISSYPSVKLSKADKEAGLTEEEVKQQRLNKYLGDVKQGLQILINRYLDKENGYICVPNKDPNSYNDYEHLERVDEWDS